MCDYSLAQVKSRLAKEGEELFVNTFHTGSKGLAAVAEWEPVKLGWLKKFANKVWSGTVQEPAHNLTAVCVPHGAKLMLANIPLSTRQELDVNEVEVVTFHQNLESPGHRDMFKFANGRIQIVQLFHEGLRVTVLALELEEESEAVIEERRMSANV
jgi:hypothetical protein